MKGTVRFCDLVVGQAFRFDSEWTFPFSGMKAGLARKISTLKYRYTEDDMECEVGNRKTLVVPCDE